MPKLPKCESKSVDASQIRYLRDWAANREQVVTVLDLETTTYIPTVKWFGITEIALLHIYPDGAASSHAALVDPERHISKKVTELTGIRNEDVRGQPTWAAWSEYLHHVAAENITVGYCSFGFDCPGVIGQNARYGLDGTEFTQHLDVYALPGVSGKLAEAAASFGVTSDTYHRALADVWVTAKLLDKVAATHGLGVLGQHIGQRPTRGGASGQFSPREERSAELLRHFEKTGGLPDLDEFGSRHGIKRSTAEGDVVRLIEAGQFEPEILENPEVQEWLSERIEMAIAEQWVGEAQGHLKPLMEALAQDGPHGLDYTQLRLALRRRSAFR